MQTETAIEELKIEWSEALAELKGVVGEDIHSAYFSTLRFEDWNCDNHTIRFSAPTKFSCHFVKTNYMRELQHLVNTKLETKFRIELIAREPKPSAAAAVENDMEELADDLRREGKAKVRVMAPKKIHATMCRSAPKLPETIEGELANAEEPHENKRERLAEKVECELSEKIEWCETAGRYAITDDFLKRLAAPVIGWKQTIRAVELKHGITLKEMRGKSRLKHVCAARNEAIYTVYNTHDYSMPQVGKIFHRDHTSVLNSIRKHESELADAD